ncbi:MAG: Ig-like domain-containing protein [Gammaproteobacteria bacterium]
MRKLLAAGIVAAGALGVSMQANALATVYEMDGTFSDVEQACTQITLLFGGSDCTYGRNRAGAAGSWIGGLFSGGHYPQDGVKDQPSYVPTSGVFDRPSQTFAPAAPDGKIAAPVSGTFTIDDNGTPGDPTDDLLSSTFTIGNMARNIATGQTTRAIQRWTTMDHVMAPTAVNATATVANGAGGVDYVIGTRGFPTPRCSKTNASDCFPTANSSSVFTDLDNTPEENAVSFWVQIPVGQVGIERVGLLGDPNFVLTQPPPADSAKTGNRGATSTATFTGYSCSYNSLSANDCAASVLVWSAAEPAGFDNMIMKVSTDSLGAITSARIYWTEEYFIGFGGAPPGYDNSYQAGAIDFTGVEQSLAPNARDFAATVIEDTTTNTLNAIGNVVNFAPTIVISIVTPPTQGTATVNGNGTINYDASGVAPGPQTIVYEATNGTDTDQGTITITVAADISPVAPDGTITISTQGAAPGSGTVGTVNVTSLAGYSAGNTPPSTITITTPPNGASGVAAVTGTTIRFTPAATFFAGSDTIGYTITDSNGDTDAGVITVTVTDVTPVLADGSLTTNQDTTSSQLTLGITPGNGSVAQHTLTVSTQGTGGSCALSGTKVTYTPNSGFFGTDSCVITIADGDGDTDTGTIDITVIEADDQLKLPGGGSAVDPWSLLLLGALPLLRRRRRA